MKMGEVVTGLELTEDASNESDAFVSLKIPKRSIYTNSVLCDRPKTLRLSQHK